MSASTSRPGRRVVVGSPEVVRAGLERVAAEYGADEAIVVTITHDHEARRRSYELLAEAFGLDEASDRRRSSPPAAATPQPAT